LEIVRLPITDTIDLHTFRPREVAGLVEEYLYQAVRKGLVRVRVIHGRGSGTQRKIVHAILRKHPQVIRFQDAEDHGSTIVILKQSAPSDS
jgi:dsDNA-specific endonuclease/ATPase MutS2